MTNEDKPLFRVGGVYRNQRGDVTRINSVQCAASGFFHGFFDGDTAVEVSVLNDDGTERWQDGWRRLSDGKYREADCPIYNLIPGELELRDGQWVPVEEKEEGVFLAGPDATFKEVVEALIDLHAEMAEPKRAPLDWNKSTPFDPWKGYVVKSDTGHIEHTPSPLTLSTDLEPASHQVRAAFGSAELVR
jgi:hypothetical protein